MVRRCTKCELEKNDEDFYKKKDGALFARCKSCICEEQKRKTKLKEPRPAECRLCGVPHPRAARGRQGTCKSCRDKRWEDNRRKEGRDPEAIRRQSRHNVDQRVVREMKKDSCCEICGKDSSLVLDHCHNSGFIRGILCQSCNVALGMFKDDPILLQKAAVYIKAKASSPINALHT